MSYVELSELAGCYCTSCFAGALTAGHCIDIDGDYWHDCPAVRAALKPNTTTESR